MDHHSFENPGHKSDGREWVEVDANTLNSIQHFLHWYGSKSNEAFNTLLRLRILPSNRILRSVLLQLIPVVQQAVLGEADDDYFGGSTLTDLVRGLRGYTEFDQA